MTRCIRAALDRTWETPGSLVIAGPEAISYAGFVRAVASAAGLRKPLIVAVPLGLLIAGARITRHVRTLPTVQPEEIRRLTEDKAFSIGPMRAQLGVEPISLQEGLAITFGSGVV